MKFVFHVHTHHSYDSASKAEAIVRHCVKHGVGAIAITDHNRFGGALEVERVSAGRVKVIKGEEIRTADGEVIGLFMTEEIKPGLPLLEVLDLLRKQGAVICIPHPGESLRREALQREKVLEIIDKVDIIEGYNSRTIFKKDDAWAYGTAIAHKKPILVGSDAHFVSDIARCVNHLQPFDGPAEFIEAVKASSYDEATKRKSSILTHVGSKIVKYSKKLRK